MIEPVTTKERLTDMRERQAQVYARTILRDYGRGRARHRVHEITAGAETFSGENRLFYGRVRELVEQALSGGEDP